ncbi:MAG: 3-phosphoshikimate 1-carboxyvinyltransferase [Clostridia bacterium]|nr:3-phosphoshikimate 1-carboxyvinyltransferase [Clostridia bacterium]
MNVFISPSSANGTVNAPSSKSCAHRLLICAALSDGVSVVENIGTNDDILATADCLKAMGAAVDINGTTATVKGIGTQDKKQEIQLFCNESGSTLRFLIPLTLVFSEKCCFSGSGRLMSRPQNVYKELFSEKNCTLENMGGTLTASGKLKSGIYKIRGDVSSQFITGLLFTLPLLDGDSEIVLTTPLQSAPYVDITIDALSLFGVTVNKTQNGYFIKGKQKYISRNLSAEGDWSNAAFLDAFNIAGGSVTVTGLNEDSFQGDKIYREFYAKLSNGTPEFDISDCPDLGPILITCAVLKHGALIKGTERLKIKESDRGAAMAQELKKFGVNIEIGNDYIKVPDVIPQKPDSEICCHNDHRIAMSFAVLCSVTGGTLQDAQCVNKSYPDFFTDIKNLGIIYKTI